MSVSRRQFIKNSIFAAAALGIQHRTWAGEAPAITSTASPNAKINIACIAVGGRGSAHVGPAATEHLVAICDVDQKTLDKCGLKYPNAKKFSDYRQMFDEMGKSIDAVFVATPDHCHAAASMMALKLGKACYTEKPLTWSVSEARALAEMAAEKKVATQMGNQGHANMGNRKIVEWVRDGVIGEIKEIHSWTNRPVWPQGKLERGAVKPVPEGLNWEAWQGPVAARDYTEVEIKGKWRSPVVGFNWRGWQEYGCGAIGDMGCHTWDNVFWSMQPDYPDHLELLELNDAGGKDTFAKQSKFKWVFPAKGNRPGFDAYWYSGGLKPQAPEELLKDPTRTAGGKTPEMPSAGNLYIGTKGKLLVQGSYGDSPRLIPEKTMQDYLEATKDTVSPNKIKPAPALPEGLKGTMSEHHYEFLLAARGDKPWNFPKSNFVDYSGPITEVMLLGVILERIGQVGFKIECDPVNRIIKTKEALALASREYRKGWTL